MGDYCHSPNERLGDRWQGHEKWLDSGSVSRSSSQGIVLDQMWWWLLGIWTTKRHDWYPSGAFIVVSILDLNQTIIHIM